MSLITTQNYSRKKSYPEMFLIIKKKKPPRERSERGESFFFLPEIQEASKILPAEIPITPLGIPIIPKDSLRLLKSP